MKTLNIIMAGCILLAAGIYFYKNIF